MFLSAGSFQDWLALATLLSSWIGYTCYASYKAGNILTLAFERIILPWQP